MKIKHLRTGLVTIEDNNTVEVFTEREYIKIELNNWWKSAFKTITSL